MEHSVAGIQRVVDGGFQPHHPTRLLLRGDARRKLVRQICRPTRVNGILPHGPSNLAPKYDAVTPCVDANLAIEKWYEHARAELHGLDASAKPNKIQAAKFKWAAAVGEKAEKTAGPGWKACTWRIAARAANDVSHLMRTSTGYSTALRAKLMQTVINRICSSKKEEDDRYSLQAWGWAWCQAVIDDRAVAVRLLANVADSYAAKAEKQNIVLDRNAWKTWATTG